MKNSIELDLLEQLSFEGMSLPMIRREFDSEAKYVHALRSMIACGHILMLDEAGLPIPKYLEEETLQSASAAVKCHATKEGQEQYRKYWRF
jgi:hypothetical protein